MAGLVAALGLLGAIGYFVSHTLKPEVRPSRTAAGSTGPGEAESRAQGSPATSSTSPIVATSPRRADPVWNELLTAGDRASFLRLERNLGGTSGLAVSAVGFNRSVSQVGTLRDGVAWSTIKVPIAIAVEIRAGSHPTASEQSLLRRAITASENAAAEELWASLGPASAAAVAVRDVLASAGDTTTRVETRVLRAGFTSFGQTQWSLSAQQRFVAAMPCLPSAEPVLSLMKQVVPAQRWGLGSIAADTQFKGGWGPDPEGRYLVRQMGIVRLANGRRLAASIVTIPADASFETGTANLTEIAAWLIGHVDASSVPPKRCGSG